MQRPVGYPGQPFAKLFDFRRSQYRGDWFRKRFQNEALAEGVIAIFADGVQDPQSTCAPDQDGHQVERRVDDPPGDIASECGDQYFPRFRLAALRHADRAGEGQHHDHAEQNLRRPL
jgi:hypothetical protein